MTQPGKRASTDHLPRVYSAAELASGLLCVCFPEFGPLLPRLLRVVPHRRRAAPESQALDHTLGNANAPTPPRRAWRGRGRHQHRKRHVMDSGLGMSVLDGGGRSNRGRFFPRGWVDSGLGSRAATVTDRGARGGLVAGERFRPSLNGSEMNDGLDAVPNHASKIDSHDS